MALPGSRSLPNLNSLKGNPDLVATIPTISSSAVNDGAISLTRYLLISAAIHLICVGLAIWVPWNKFNPLLESPPLDTMEVTLSMTAPAIAPAASNKVSVPIPAEATFQPSGKSSFPVSPITPATPAEAIPSVDKTAIPLITKERSLEDRRRLEKAEQKRAEKMVREPSKPAMESPRIAQFSPPVSASSKTQEIEDRLAQKLREAREAIAKAREYGTGTGIGSQGGGTVVQSNNPAQSGGSGAGMPEGTGRQSLLAAADRVQRDAYESYRGQIMAAVRDNWEVPASVKGLALESTFRIEISSDGEILSAKMLKSSGNRVFDDAVSRALSKVTSIGLPPAGFPRIVNLVFDNRSLDQ